MSIYILLQKRAKTNKDTYWNICSPNLDKSLMGISFGMEMYMHQSVGHYSNPVDIITLHVLQCVDSEGHAHLHVHVCSVNVITASS